MGKQVVHALGARGMPAVARAGRILAEGSAPRATTCSAHLASLPSAAFSLDAAGVICDANPRAEVLVGWERAHLVGMAIDRVFSGVTAALADGERDRVRWLGHDDGVRAYHRNGGDIPVCLIVCPHGHRATLIVQPAGLADGDSHAEEVAQIVHDLKSPLSTMTLELCVFEYELADKHHDQLRPTVARLLRNVTYLDRIVQDLLDTCAFDTGHFVLQRRTVDLRALLARVIDRAVPICDRGRVVLEAPRTRFVDIDDLRIERVVANLLGNALQYSPPSAAVVVRLRCGRDRVWISVSDGGPGIPADERTQIFDKYRRGSTSAGRNGCGLGLYVSRRIVEAHGGRIEAEPLRTGMRLVFELPCDER